MQIKVVDEDMLLNRFVNIDHVEFMVTYRCNSQCLHCYVGQDRRLSYPVAIEEELATQIIKEVVREHSPQSMMILGGEPLLFPDITCAILETARREGIRSREIITNAGWPYSDTDFRRVALRLGESGVTRTIVSVDSFHQQHIPLAMVERNVQILKEAGVAELSWNPCWVISRDQDNLWNRRTKEVLKALKHLGVTESRGDIIQPLGNALTNLVEFLPARTANPKGACEDIPYAQRLDQISNISIEPDGSVAICKAFVIGNARVQNINQILRKYDPYKIPEVEAILSGGTGQLVNLARNQGIEPDPEGYYSICDMCLSLTRRMAKPVSRRSFR